MRGLSGSLLAVLFGLAGSLHAGEGWYVGGYGALTQQQDSRDVLTGDGTGGTGSLPGGGGTGGVSGGFLVIPGILTLFPSSGITGTPGTPGTPGTGGVSGGGSTKTEYDRGWGAGANLGYQFNNGFRTEVELGYRTNDIDKTKLKSGFAAADGTKLDASGDLNAISLMGNVWYNFNRNGTVQPYIGGGLGVARVELNDYEIEGVNIADDDDTVPAYQVGAGLDFMLGDRTALGIGYRYFGTKDPEFQINSKLRTEYEAHSVLASLRYRFTDVAQEPEGLLDSDGDGVPDIDDKCPGTPAGVQVGPDGCPLDSDGDGVPDYLDQCPNTPAGTQVDAKGCPLQMMGDEDGDGVPDALDECPGTPPGTKVLPNGCTEMTVEGTHFEFDRVMILPDGEKWLRRTAETLRNNTDMRVEVAGHTDNIGSDAYNLRLGERRAQAVADFLTNEGVSPGQLEVRSYGESQPVADNESEIGRWRNRRVALKVLNP